MLDELLHNYLNAQQNYFQVCIYLNFYISAKLFFPCILREILIVANVHKNEDRIFGTSRGPPRIHLATLVLLPEISFWKLEKIDDTCARYLYTIIS